MPSSRPCAAISARPSPRRRRTRLLHPRYRRCRRLPPDHQQQAADQHARGCRRPQDPHAGDRDHRQDHAGARCQSGLHSLWRSLHGAEDGRRRRSGEPALEHLVMKFYEAQKYLSLVNYQIHPDPFMVNLAWYKALPDDLKVVFDKAAKDAMAWSDEHWLASEADYLAFLERQDRGQRDHAGEPAKFIDAVQPVWDAYIADGTFTAEEVGRRLPPAYRPVPGSPSVRRAYAPSGLPGTARCAKRNHDRPAPAGRDAFILRLEQVLVRALTALLTVVFALIFVARRPAGRAALRLQPHDRRRQRSHRHPVHLHHGARRLGRYRQGQAHPHRQPHRAAAASARGTGWRCSTWC